MQAAENIDRPKTLNARSANLIFLAYFFAAIPIVALIETLGGTSQMWLGDILYPIIGCLVIVLSAVRLIPADIKRVGPTGAAWVLGPWPNLIKGLGVGCIIGGAGRMWDALTRPHAQDAHFHNSHFVEPIYRALVTPGVQQVLAIVSLALLAPVVEEMLFRGILYGGYRKSFGPLSAALVTTGLFVAIHFPYYIYVPSKIVVYIVSALALLWCRLRWNAIGPAITAHSGMNIAAGVIPSLILTWQHSFYESGVADCKAAKFNQAIASLTHAIQLGDNSSSVYVYRGIAKFDEGDMDGAISDYTMAIVLNPKDSAALYDRGLARNRTRDFEGAISDYDYVIVLDPTNSAAYDDRAVAKAGEEKFDEAITDFGKAIELDPTNSLYYNDRGWAEYQKGDFGYAIADATHSIQLEPNSAYAYGTRGWARYRMGDVSDAVEDSKKATQLYKPGSAAFFHVQGLLDFISKDYPRAVGDWQCAIQQKPDSKRELQPWIEKAQAFEQESTSARTNSLVTPK